MGGVKCSGDPCLMPQGPEGQWGLGCATLPCTSHSSFGLPWVWSRCQTCPRAGPSLEQARAQWGRDGHSLWQKPACFLQPAQTLFLPTFSPHPIAPHSPDWGPTPPAECLPVLPGRARLLQQGLGCAWVSPCHSLELVGGLAVHVALQASPLLGSRACWKA